MDGMVASMSIAAATGTAVFLAFAEQVLIPALRQRPDALVVMDNLSAHKAEAVRAALANDLDAPGALGIVDGWAAGERGDGSGSALVRDLLDARLGLRL